MGIIRIPLRFEGLVGEKNVYALFDSGATFSCIRDDIAREIEEQKNCADPWKWQQHLKGITLK